MKVQRQADITITRRDVEIQLKTVPNWKSPGPGGIQGFWLKRFSNLHAQIARPLNNCVSVGHVPDWMVEGRTTLIMKDKRKGALLGNYRPIACLNLLWKLLTGIFVLDQAVLRNCKRRRTNKKAYDMVPHSWVRQCLKMFGVAGG